MAHKKKTGRGCRLCGNPTGKSDRVCLVCGTADTVVHGLIEEEIPGRKDDGKSEVQTPTLSEGLQSALDLEAEGRRFYMDCAEKTSDEQGKLMFRFLAGEEEIHYDRISKVLREIDFEGYCNYVEAKGVVSGVFHRVWGAGLKGGADALDALNAGIEAEDRSIALYKKLIEKASNQHMRAVFEKLVEEERTHRIILEKEVEFVTDTGEFRDFKTVTA